MCSGGCFSAVKLPAPVLFAVILKTAGSSNEKVSYTIAYEGMYNQGQQRLCDDVFHTAAVADVIMTVASSHFLCVPEV